MVDSANVAVVRRFYDNLSSPEVLAQVLSPNIRWEIVPGFPYGGDYIGVDAVFRDFFGRLLSDFDDWRTVMNEVHDVGNRVLALGTTPVGPRRQARPSLLASRIAGPWTVDRWFASNSVRTRPRSARHLTSRSSARSTYAKSGLTSAWSRRA